MARDPADFLHRWSRRKHAANAVAPAAPAVPAALEAPLPPLSSVSFESGIGAFMQDKVDEALKRAALRKLFSDPRFNVMDGLDIYIDDYSIAEPIPAAMLAGLEHARAALLRTEERVDEVAEKTAETEGERGAGA